MCHFYSHSGLWQAEQLINHAPTMKLESALQSTRKTTFNYGLYLAPRSEVWFAR